MYSGKKVFVVLLSVMLMSSLALAATFSAGGGQGVSTVGTLGGEDYATLAAAATDFNTYAGGCTGDWTLQITSDLTETVNVYFGNATNGHTVTIRPAPGISPTVNLNGPSGTIGGHLGIGANADNFANLVKTDNFVINGCSDDAWSTRSLTLVNRLVSLANTRIVLVVGDSDNAVIKNCIINNRSTNATGNANVGVEFLTRYTNPDVFVPDNGIVENCDITASTNLGGYGTGIRQTTSVAPPAGNAQTGMIFRDNIINAGMYGIQLAQTAGADVYNNTIRLTQLTSGRQVYGILFSASNNTSNWTLNIYNNTIDKLQTVSAGAAGINLGAVAIATAQTPVTYNVYNNMICGYNFTSAANISNAYYYGIYCDSYCSTTTNRNVFLNFHHNSIYMPHFATLIYTTDANRRQRAYGLGCHAQISRARTIDFRNNNIRVEQAGAACIHPGISTTYATRTINYNNLSADTSNGAFTAFYNYSSQYSTLADWQAALYKEYDQNSVAVDPLTAQAPLTGVWTAANNLLYTSYPSSSLHALPVTGITTDIKGAARSAVHPFMGCEEWQPTGPKAQLLTDGLNFGRALIQTAGGIPNAPKSLMIRNVGTSDLIISGVSYQSGSAEFTFSSVDSPIAPGATGSCTLLYTANTLGPVSAVFQIASNDAYEPNKNFDVLGEGRLTKKFSEIPAGRGPSLLGNGVDDDYATLDAAAFDFNTQAGGCTGDWNVFITSDLTEPANVAFGNNVPTSYTVTIRPQAGVSPTINFTQTSVNTIPGHWIIGATDRLNLASLVKTDNFVINGCADDAWSTRSMTIRNLDTVSMNNSRLILVFGDSDHFTVKNCNLINGSRSVGDNGCTGVEFQSRFDGANTYIPDYGTVDNCSINVLSGTVTTGRYATGVKQFYSGTIPVGLAQWGLTVSNCDINARYIGIFLGQTAGATIHDNTIRLNQYSASTHIYGIYHLNASGNNGASGWTMDIFNNKFDELINVNTGTSVIYLGTGTYSVAHDPITFNVYNNMICGFDFTVATPTANIYYRGISCDYASDVSFDINCNFYNNSIYMPHFPNLTYTLENTTSRRCAYAIGSPNASYRARTLRFRNNNVRVEQFYAASIHYARYSTNAIVDIDYNNISADTANGAYVGRLHDYYAFFEYTTVEDWRTASGKPDANSFTVNPLVPHAPFTGTWTAANDLYFTSYPSAKMAGAPIAAVTADIDGAPRSTIAPLMGCHELALTGAKIVLLADTLDFGYRKLIPNNGVSVNGKVKYRNVGPVPLSLTGAALVAGSTDFSFVSAQSPIAPGATGECTVKYSPYNSGLTTGTLRISTSNDFYEPTVDFNVQGIGTLPRVSVGAPTGTNWGYCFVGQNQGTKKVRISNIGNVPLLVTGITITGDPDMSVVYVPSTPFTLPAFGYYEAITLEYTPSSIGLHQKFISVTTDDYLNSPINLTIEGTGIEVTAAEEPFFVGYAKTAAVGGVGLSRDLEILNNSPAPTTYTISISDTHFIAPDPVLVLDPNSSGTIQIIYLPTAVEDNTATYDLIPFASGYPTISGTLLGRGWTQTQGRRVFMDGAIGGTVQVDTAGTYTHTRIIVPPGAFTGIREVRLQEPATPFGRKNAIELRTYPGDNFAVPATLYVEFLENDLNAFAPSTLADIGVGRWWGGWRMMQNTTGTGSLIEPGKYEVAFNNLWNLSAPYVYSIVPASIGVQPATLDFGPHLILSEGGISVTQTLDIVNRGALNLTITNIVRVAGSPDFSIDGFASPITPGSSGLCTVRYNPATVGPVSTTFRIVPGDPAEPTRDFTVLGVGKNTKKFSAFPSGRGHSLVGNSPEADYLSLAEAAADFNSVAGGCTGDWNLWIITDLTEPANVAFGNTVPSNFTVTVRPLAGIEPKVTFTQETVGALPGHLVIGASDLATTASIIKTDNFIINGFADDADTTRSITFLNRNDVAIADSRLILVIGDSDNIAIRNCNLINASQSNAENGCTAVGFMSWNDGILNNIPDQGIVENCVITAQGGSSVTGRYGIGVSQSALGTIGAGVAQTGLVVNGCEINARYAGILLGQAKGATIQDNTIRLNQFAPGTHIRGIWLESENMTSGWILDVFNNTINELVNVDTGITAIDLDDTEYSAEHTAITMNVFNNMICGFEFTAAAPANDVIYRGIYCDRGSDFVAPVTFNCFFNSIYMPGFANLTYTAGNPTGQNAAFAIGAPAGDSVRTLDVRNNIIRLEQNYAAAINYKSNLDKTLFIGNYNDLSVNTTAGAFTGRYTDFTSLTEYAELADWRNSPGSPETAGVSVDPFIASPPFIGTWTAPVNLLFTTYHSSALIGTPIAGITTDIRGTVRNATRPYMGCDEHYFSGRPSVVITVNPPAVNEDNVPVSFNIVALDSIPSTIMVEYSINGGAAWTPTTNFTGDSTGLAASPAGVEHSITWNPIDDLGEVDANCLLRISARADLSPGEWGDPGVTSEFAVNNARSYPVIHYPSPATDGWVKSYGTLADGTFINAVDGAFYIATHSSASGQVSVGAGTGATDTRNMAGGWQSPNTDIPYLENTVYIARFKVSTNQASLNNVPNTRLYAEFINSAGSLAVAGGTRVGRGPFAPNASGNTYSVYIQGASSMSPDIEYVRLKFEVIDFDPNEWGTSTLQDVDVYRFEEPALDPARKIATFEPPFANWTGTGLGSPFGNATFGSNTTGLWIETPVAIAGSGRTVDYAFWQIPASASGLAYEADRLYRTVWTLSVPDVATEGTCARIRMITNNAANNWGSELVADPGAGYREQMPKVGGTEYSVWQETLPQLYSGGDAILNNMFFLFDVADGSDSQSGRIYLRKVDLYYYDIP